MDQKSPRGAQVRLRAANLWPRFPALVVPSGTVVLRQRFLPGNIPDFMRNLTPVTLKSADTTVTICVTPDYVAIGNDTDHVRVPMGLPAAAQIADGLGFMLPTTRMVDAIYADAGVQLTPQPMTPNSQMTSNNYIRRHNATIERQLVAADAVTGTLTAGPPQKTWCCPTACAPNQGGWRSMGGIGSTAGPSSRSARFTVSIMRIIRTGYDWSAGRRT